MINVRPDVLIGLKVTLASATLVVTTIALWRVAYRFGDISSASLIPLSILMLIGSYITALQARKASLDSILSETTGLRKLLKGRVTSAVLSLIITASGIFLVAYKGLVSQSWEQIVGISSVVLISVFFVFATKILAPHVNKNYLLAAATRVTVVLVGTIFFAVYVYGLWNIQTNTVGESLSDSINLALNALPQGSGITAVLLEVATVVEAAKVWAVGETDSVIRISPIVYVFYGAIFGYFQTRVIVSVVCAILMILQNTQKG